VRRLTEQDMADVEKICSQPGIGVAPAIARMLVAEIRALRLTAEEREALRWLIAPERKWLHSLAATPQLGPPITRALAVLAKLTRGEP
jgi:hypothetical protein